MYVYGKVCTVFLHGDKTSYVIPTPVSSNRYMIARTVNLNTSQFGDVSLSPLGNASFVGQTGENTAGIITYIMA